MPLRPKCEVLHLYIRWRFWVLNSEIRIKKTYIFRANVRILVVFLIASKKIFKCVEIISIICYHQIKDVI